MTSVLEVLGALAFGVGSALLPVVNAEAYALVRAGQSVWGALLVVLALAIGQTAGKLVLFEAARRGSGLLRPRKPVSERRSRWAQRAATLLTDNRTAAPAVLASALVGLPPLAAVSIAAGAAGQSRRLFLSLCLAGRTVRFGLVALPVLLASHGLV